MKLCLSCKELIREVPRFCPNCGNDLRQVEAATAKVVLQHLSSELVARMPHFGKFVRRDFEGTDLELNFQKREVRIQLKKRGITWLVINEKGLFEDFSHIRTDNKLDEHQLEVWARHLYKFVQMQKLNPPL